MIGSLESAVIVASSSEPPAATHENTLRVESVSNMDSQGPSAGTPSVGQSSIGAESTVSELVSPAVKSAFATLAGTNVADRLNESIVAWYARTPDDQAVRFEMRLDPPELGRVTIRLEKSKGKVTVKLLVANEAARVAVERELPALQQSLEDAGVNLDQFDLSKHSGRHSDDRSDRDRSPMLQWMPEREVGTSPPTTVQTDGTTAGQVDLRV